MSEAIAKSKEERQESEHQFIEFFRDVRGQFVRGKPTKIVLRHLRTTGLNDDIETWDEPEYFEGLDPGEFAKEVVARVEEEVKFLSGWNHYGVFFFRKGEKQKHDTRLRLSIMGEQDDDTSQGFSSETADDAGRKSQLMRHDEAFAKLAFQAMSQVQTTQLRQLERSEAMVDKLLGNSIKVMETLQVLLDKTAERDLKIERDKKMYGLMDEGLDKVMALAPALIAAKVEKSNPQLAAAIRQATVNPANAILEALLKELESNPEKAKEIFARVVELPNGMQLLQMLQQMQEMQKAGQKG